VVKAKRVERIWRRQGLKVPQRQPKRGRLWLADGFCIRPRPGRAPHVSACASVGDSADDARKFRRLTVIDEVTRESLATMAARRLASDDVLAAVAEVFIARWPPEHLRSDQRPEFNALVVKAWLGRRCVAMLPIATPSPWENGDGESVDGTLRDALLDREIFHSLAGARADRPQAHPRHHRPAAQQTGPHSRLGRTADWAFGRLGRRPPAPERVRPPCGPWRTANAAEEAAMH